MTRVPGYIPDEDEFQRLVIELAHVYGWMAAHFRPAMTKHGWRTPAGADGKGWPDLVLVHPKHGVIYAEVKSQKGRLSPDQIRWRDALVAAGQRWYLWRAGTPLDRIAAQLQDGRGDHHDPGGAYPLVAIQEAMFT